MTVTKCYVPGEIMQTILLQYRLDQPGRETLMDVSTLLLQVGMVSVNWFCFCSIIESLTPGGSCC